MLKAHTTVLDEVLVFEFRRVGAHQRQVDTGTAVTRHALLGRTASQHFVNDLAAVILTLRFEGKPVPDNLDFFHELCRCLERAL